MTDNHSYGHYFSDIRPIIPIIFFLKMFADGQQPNDVITQIKHIIADGGAIDINI